MKSVRTVEKDGTESKDDGIVSRRPESSEASEKSGIGSRAGDSCRQ
jgi:hypothetical protein